MPVFDPESARGTRSSFRWLLPALVVALVLASAGPLTSPVAAQEVVPAPPADASEPAPAVTTERPPEQAPAPEPAPEPAPAPDPVPEAGPAPEPVPAPPENPAPPPGDEQQPATQKAGTPSTTAGSGTAARERQSAAPASPPPVVVIPAVVAADPTVGSGPVAPTPEALALGWDVYDDALFAEALDGDDGSGGAAQPAGGPPAALGGIVALGGIGPGDERDDHHGAQSVSRAEPMSAGNFGPGGPGPGQGPSLSLFGGSGGSAAGVALLTLLGMLGTWLLAAPNQLRAFRTSAATWRLSAYVPPIEHPG